MVEKVMSKDGETGQVFEGIQHGACDYLLKPVRMKELRNIWQHVFRKKIHEVRDIELIEGINTIQRAQIGCGLSDNGHFFYGQDATSIKKRKDVESKNDDKGPSDSSSSKTPRVVWSFDLHQIFIEVVNQIGFDKVGPMKILELMNVPSLTRDNVSYHLQKYRLYLSRIQKFSYSKALSPVSSTESSTESVGSFALSFSGSCSSTRSITASECSCNGEASNVTEWSGTSAEHQYLYKEVQAKYTTNEGHETGEQEQEDEVVSKLAMEPINVSSSDSVNLFLNEESNGSHSTSSESSAGSGAKAAAFGSVFLFQKSHNDEHK